MSDMPLDRKKWQSYYKNHAAIYDKLASAEYKNGKILKLLMKHYDLSNKIVIDIGSGTGRTSIAISRYAKFVYAVEPQKEMMAVGVNNAKLGRLRNIRFLKGRAEKIPLAAKTADAAVAVMSILGNYSDFSDVDGSLKTIMTMISTVLKKNGTFIILNLAPHWRGGELAKIIYGPSGEPKGSTRLEVDKLLRTKYGFKYTDAFITIDFGSVREAIDTYGFIFGEKAITYLKKHDKSSITMKFRIYKKEMQN